MEYLRLMPEDIWALWELHTAYKNEIGEDEPGAAERQALQDAIRDEAILFFGCVYEGDLIGVCSVSRTFSTYNYASGGVFEDFYIVPEYRHRGIARALVRFAYEHSGVSSLTVGAAACDCDMYKSLGFSLPLGHLLAYEA